MEFDTDDKKKLSLLKVIDELIIVAVFALIIWWVAYYGDTISALEGVARYLPK